MNTMDNLFRPKVKELCDKIAQSVAGEETQDALAALTLLLCFAIDHANNEEAKNALYKSTTRTMQAILDNAPSVGALMKKHPKH